MSERLSHLRALEAESIYIIREVAFSFSNPCMFYLIGKDSTVMLHLARKAFYPGKMPLTLLHIDTTGQLLVLDEERMLPFLSDTEKSSLCERRVRFRTLGCYPQTGAVASEADTVPAIIQEMLLSKTSERQGRLIDTDQAGSMEKKKQEGYF